MQNHSAEISAPQWLVLCRRHGVLQFAIGGGPVGLVAHSARHAAELAAEMGYTYRPGSRGVWDRRIAP